MARNGDFLLCPRSQSVYNHVAFKVFHNHSTVDYSAPIHYPTSATRHFHDFDLSSRSPRITPSPNQAIMPFMKASAHGKVTNHAEQRWERPSRRHRSQADSSRSERPSRHRISEHNGQYSREPLQTPHVDGSHAEGHRRSELAAGDARRDGGYAHQIPSTSARDNYPTHNYSRDNYTRGRERRREEDIPPPYGGRGPSQDYPGQSYGAFSRDAGYGGSASGGADHSRYVPETRTRSGHREPEGLNTARRGTYEDSHGDNNGQSSGRR